MMRRKKSRPEAGYYVDSYHEYDIRHFVGRAAKSIRNVQRVLEAQAADGWICAYRLNNKHATFIVLCRVRPSPLRRPEHPSRS